MLKENILANLISKLKILELFNWSIVKEDVSSEILFVNMRLKKEEVMNLNGIGQGHYTNALINQYIIGIDRSVISTLFSNSKSQGYIYGIKDDSISFSEIEILRSIDNKLSEISIDDYDYIIVNSQIASILQDSFNYTIIPNTVHNNTPGLCESIGKWRNTTIYLNPSLKWEENKIYLGKKTSTLGIFIKDSEITDDKLSISGGYNLHEGNNLICFSIILNENHYNEAKPVLRQLALIKMGI